MMTVCTGVTDTRKCVRVRRAIPDSCRWTTHYDSNICLYQKSTDTPSPFSNTSPMDTVHSTGIITHYSHFRYGWQLSKMLPSIKKNFSRDQDRMNSFNKAVTC